MKPIKFPEQNVTYAEDQPEYLNLPAYRDREGKMVACWSLTFWERAKLLFTGKIWISMLTFKKPLTPHKLSIDSPFPTELGDYEAEATPGE